MAKGKRFSSVEFNCGDWHATIWHYSKHMPVIDWTGRFATESEARNAMAQIIADKKWAVTAW